MPLILQLSCRYAGFCYRQEREWYEPAWRIWFVLGMWRCWIFPRVKGTVLYGLQNQRILGNVVMTFGEIDFLLEG